MQDHQRANAKSVEAPIHRNNAQAAAGAQKALVLETQQLGQNAQNQKQLMNKTQTKM
jgi:hypothetical protein